MRSTRNQIFKATHAVHYSERKVPQLNTSQTLENKRGEY